MSKNEIGNQAESVMDPILREGRPTLEVFTGGCELCRQALRDSMKVAEAMGFGIVEHKVDSDRGRALGLRAAPSVVMNGQVLFPYAPTEDELIAKLNALGTS